MLRVLIHFIYVDACVQEEGEGLNPNEIIKGCSLSETKYILEHFYTKSIETVSKNQKVSITCFNELIWIVKTVVFFNFYSIKIFEHFTPGHKEELLQQSFCIFSGESRQYFLS